MARTIQIKRGAKSTMPNLAQGELGFVTDTGAEELYVGNGTENIQIARQDYVDGLVESMSDSIHVGTEALTDCDLWIDTDDETSGGEIENAVVTAFNGRVGAIMPEAGDYTAAMVGAPTIDEMNQAIAAIPTPDVSGQIDTHNTDTSAHADIRIAASTAKSAIDEHIADKNNPHGVTAEQVGARPDTWLPTVEELGAATEDHAHTAEEVGAVSKSGDTMSGNLTIHNTAPIVYLKDSDTEGIGRIQYNDALTDMVNWGVDGTAFAALRLASGDTAADDLLKIDGYNNGSAIHYNVLHTGNKSLIAPADIGASESGHKHAAGDITSGTLGVARGGTGATTFTSGAALIGAGTGAVTTRSITNTTSASTAISANTNLITSNTLRYALNRTTGPTAADTNYGTAMMRAIYAGTSDMTAGTTSLTSGAIYFVYE